MQQFIIEGKHKLSGSIKPQGNKNEALPALCAAVLSPKEVTLRNLPDIQDIRSLKTIVESIGAKITDIDKDPHNVKIDASNIDQWRLKPELTSAIRGSVTLLGPMLGRLGQVYLPKPGGDKIGRRRVDTHLQALHALGAEVNVYPDGYEIKAKKLKGANMLLDEASVTGTENAVMAAAVAEGTTVIENAACEPHVQGVCRMLEQMGVSFNGIGSNILTVEGVGSFEKLKPCDHTIGPDYLEVGSFICMAALTDSAIRIEDVNPTDLRMIRMVFERLGIQYQYEEQNGQVDCLVSANQPLEIRTDVHGEVPKIDDAPWPAFPADLVSIALVMATQCKGTVLVHEKLFESRLFFTDKLLGMGARIVLCDPHRAVVIGPAKLYGSRMSSPDIRAGMALVLAALAAEGTSHIQNIFQVDRGYERIDERLRSLGGHIERTEQ